MYEFFENDFYDNFILIEYFDVQPHRIFGKEFIHSTEQIFNIISYNFNFNHVARILRSKIE